MNFYATGLRAAAIAVLLFISIGRTANAEDPAVTRAREEARQEYELEKVKRELAEMKEKEAKEQALRRAIALTKQGVVSIHNPTTSTLQHIPIVYRWKLWDGSYTDWIQAKVPDNKNWFYFCPGAVIFQVKFSSTGGGEKNYALELNQMPSDIKASFDDGQHYTFAWGKHNDLTLFKGKPQN